MSKDTWHMTFTGVCFCIAAHGENAFSGCHGIFFGLQYLERPLGQIATILEVKYPVLKRRPWNRQNKRVDGREGQRPIQQRHQPDPLSLHRSTPLPSGLVILPTTLVRVHACMCVRGCVSRSHAHWLFFPARSFRQHWPHNMLPSIIWWEINYGIYYGATRRLMLCVFF